MAKNYYGEVVSIYVRTYRDAITMLVGRVNSGTQENALNIVPSKAHRELSNYLNAVLAFWAGHADRCNYYIKKIFSEDKGGRHHKRFFIMYYGLNALRLLSIRKTSRAEKKATRMALETLREAAGHSKWNFQNKVCLLRFALLLPCFKYIPITSNL